MNFLILGSCGFIGNALSNYLKSLNHNVLEFDIQINTAQDLRIPSNKNLIEIINFSDFVFFLAFDVGGAKYLSKKNGDFEFLSNNLKILVNTFEILKNTNKRFIFVSSYQIHKPNHSYAITKLIGEQFSSSLGGLVVRLYNVYGEEIVGPRSHVIPDLIQQALFSKKITLSTNGKEKRQFLYVDDCCKGLYSAFVNFDSILKEANVIDLTSYKWHSIKQVANKIGKKIKCEVEAKDVNASFTIMPEPRKTILKYWNAEIDIDNGIDKILKNYL